MPGAVHCDHVELSFAEDRKSFFSHFLPGEVKRIKDASLFEYRCFGAVDVLCPFEIFLNGSRTESDNASLFVPDGEHEAVAEAVVDFRRGVVRPDCDSGGDKLLFREPLTTGVIHSRVPFVDGGSDPEFCNDLRRQSAGFEIFRNGG